MKPKLEAVKDENEPARKESPLLAVAVRRLEEHGGNLDKFLAMYNQPDSKTAPEVYLFRIYAELEKAQNVALKDRWHKALKLFAKIRMDCLRLKAFDLLDSYENKSATTSTSDIAFAKAILLVTQETAAGVISGTTTKQEEKEADDIDEMNAEFDKAGDDE